MLQEDLSKVEWQRAQQNNHKTMSTSTPGASAAIVLSKQFKRMQKEDHIDGISVGLVDGDNIFEWEVMLMINDDCKFYGGMFF